MSRVDVYQGDSREVLRVLDDASIDAVVTDPPYALVSIGKRFGADGAAPSASDGATGVYARASAGFMGQKWDTGDTAFDPAFWAEVLRVMKPGAHLVAFSATRTYHRLACAIEDAGFEIRDMTAWLYGSGFPKSHYVAKGIDAYLGEEREVIGRREVGKDMRGGNYKASAPQLVADITVSKSAEAEAFDGWGTALKPALEPICLARKPLIGSVARNVLATGCGGLNIDGCRIGDEGGAVFTGLRNSADHGSVSAYGDGLNGKSYDVVKGLGRWPANVLHDGSDEVLEAFPCEADGSAARFFYSAKADVEDRLGSDHPTVKPVDLMAWLVRLITPAGGVVLDPFGGSGTTGLAAMNEGRDAILIEREAKFADDIRRRIAWARGEGRLTAQERARAVPEEKRAAMPLFDEAS